MKVYIVTHGEYSDKKNIAVFDDQQTAQRVADMIDGGVEPYELNHFNHEEPPAGKKFFRVAMRNNGYVVKVEETSVLSHFGEQHRTYYNLNKRWKGWTLYGYLYADSEEHAVKIVNEWRGQILAGVRPEHCDDDAS